MEITNCDVFYAHIPHSDINFIEQVISEYEDVTTYLIGLELGTQTKVEHMHFIVESVGKGWYHKFSKRIFIDKYHLNGVPKTVNGKAIPKEYGKVKKVRDWDKMHAYTVKDGNIRTNMSQSVIDKYVQMSHKKSESRDYTIQLLSKIDDFDEKHFRDYYTCPKHCKKEDFSHWLEKQNFFADEGYQISRKRNILIYIIKQLKEKNIESITKGQVDSYWNKWTTSRWNENEIYNDRYAR